MDDEKFSWDQAHVTDLRRSTLIWSFFQGTAGRGGSQGLSVFCCVFRGDKKSTAISDAPNIFLLHRPELSYAIYIYITDNFWVFGPRTYTKKLNNNQIPKFQKMFNSQAFAVYTPPDSHWEFTFPAAFFSLHEW